jgi:uncharacterized membrane protein YgcG
MTRSSRLARRLGTLLAALSLALAVGTGSATAADFTLAHSPGTVVYDEAGVLAPTTATIVPTVLADATALAGVDPVFYVRRVPDAAGADADADASSLVAAWLPAAPEVRDTLVVILDVAGEPACPVDVGIRVGPAWADLVSASAVRELVDSQLLSAMKFGCDPDMILVSAAGGVYVAATSGQGTDPGGTPPTAGAPDAPPVGPPWPEPEDGRRVYDFAGAFSEETVAATEAAIDRIEERTGAQVAVYTQVKPGADASSTEQDAISLMDAWGVGRKGFDDGLVILWNLDESLRHGQVQLYAGPGYRNIVSNEQRQSIFENDMVPYLQGGDLDGAMTVAMQRLEELTTPENASRLQFFRQANAVVGLLGIVLLVILAAWPIVTWYRRGRDPAVTQSASMLMPDPPAEMTPALGAVVDTGGSSRRALTAAMLDIASRGDLAFEQEETGHFIKSEKLALRLTSPDLDDPRTVLNRRAATGPAEGYILMQVRNIAGTDDRISPDELLKLGAKVPTFDTMLEKRSTDLGWFAAPPGKVRGRWAGLGSLELVVGFVVVILAFVIPASGLTLVGGGVGAAGIVTLVAATAMPARTQKGALARVWLDGYRRTLKATMAQARSMDEVVEKSGLAWLETPDRAVAWGTALGLQDEIEEVLARSVEDVREGTASAVWFPVWYHAAGDRGGWSTAGAGGVAPGLMSASAIPDFGGMMSALGTIGNSPSSSGGGSGGGGFGGGGSGGGGGGAGGGF